MLRLFDLKKKEEANAATKTAGSAKQIAPGLIRMQKDMAELGIDQDKDIKLTFPNGPDDLMHFKVRICPCDGIYRGGKFMFDFKIPSAYPHEAPKVLCETTVFHPNIDMEGHVCLNILREDWNPVLTIRSVILGLQFIMLEPNPDDPLNKEAAAMQTESRGRFERLVRDTFKGGMKQAGSGRYQFPKFE